ncbi:hypothetical protein POTOM_024159 [Populus tomentosa]|uniref:Uncharacterized protein n=1 Tax=Populus tomentosa TaxID=118781 RepID=A0A8X7ZMT8_POPTO|nr:hypothetical protein POTOM_024159 [Populus tomentosa]
MSLKFNSPFLGIPVIAPLNGRNRPNSVYSGRGQLSKRGFRKCICVKKHSDWVAQALRFSHFWGKDVELARNANESGVECVKESFVQKSSVRLKREHLNIAKFEPEHGLDPMLDLVLAAGVFESQLAESISEGNGQLAFKKLATATLEQLMPRIEGKGEFGHAGWRLVYAPDS